MGGHRRLALLLGLLAISLPIAGCLGMELDSSERQDRDGTMTAEEEVREDEGVAPNAPPFYAEEVHRITGEITLDELRVTLATVNGPVNVTAGDGTAWQLVARLTGYGTTPEEAETQRDRLTLNWSIGTPGDRSLTAFVEQEDQAGDTATGARTEASLDLVLPRPVLATLTATSTNGEVNVVGLEALEMTLTVTNGRVHVQDTTAQRLTATSTNGLVDVTVEGTQTATLASTNGQVLATVIPGATGVVTASSTNGGVNVQVPEDASHGYVAEATSANGLAAITLQDGETSSPSDPGHATFRTDGFENRDIQTTVTVTSTNGGVHLGPAGPDGPAHTSSSSQASPLACPLAAAC